MKAQGLLLLALSTRLFAQLAPTEELPALRPPRPEIPPTFWAQYGLWITLGAVLLLVLAGVVVWFLIRPKPPVVVSPGVQVRRALEALREQPESGATLSRISQVLRQYVAAVFRFPPGELTTTEFCLVLDAHPEVGPSLSAAIGAFLRQCDLRKFGSAPPVEPLGAVTQGLRFVEQAEARLALWAQNASPAATEAEAGKPQTEEGK